MDISPQHMDSPQRLSCMYQYHNAPEVAPAHGLEYDDTIYPSSDKCPAVREHYLPGSTPPSSYGYMANNRPPRIIFGMKVRTFLMVAAVMAVVIIATAVGGAIGGEQLREHATTNENPLAADRNTSVSTTTGEALSAGSSPTNLPLSGCSGANKTNYTSLFSNSTSTVGLQFTKLCNVQNPLDAVGAELIVGAYVYTFNDCIDVCAGYNHWNGGANCTVAVYKPNNMRPTDCWIGNAGSKLMSHLGVSPGSHVAILDR